MTSAKVNIHLDDASDASVKVVWKDIAGNPVDVTAFNWTMTLYKYAESAVDTLTSVGGGINLQPSGLIVINFDRDNVEGYPSEVMYDLMFVNKITSKAGFLMRGTVKINYTQSRVGA